RRIVFDNDFQPNDLMGKLPPRWGNAAGEDGWTPEHADEPKIFRTTARDPGNYAWLRYSHYIPDHRRSSQQRELITDFIGYNTWEPRPERDTDPPTHPLPAQNWVGDLMLELDLQVEQAQGEFALELSKGVDRFQARFSLADGTCTLVRLTNGLEQIIETRPT